MAMVRGRERRDREREESMGEEKAQEAERIEENRTKKKSLSRCKLSWYSIPKAFLPRDCQANNQYFQHLNTHSILRHSSACFKAIFTLCS